MTTSRLASGLKLLGLDTTMLGVVLLVVCIVGPVTWAVLRRRNGMPALAYRDPAIRPVMAPAAGEAGGSER